LNRFAEPGMRTAAIASAVFFVSGIILSLLGPSIPSLSAALEQSPDAIGYLYTFFSIGVVTAQFVTVELNKRFGKRITLGISAILLGLASILLGFGINLPIIWLAAFLSGLGYGGILNTASVLVAQHFLQNSAPALNAINVFYGVGAIIGPFIAAGLSTVLGSIHSSLMVGGLLLLLASPLVFFGVVERQISSSQQQQHRDAAAQSGQLNAWLLIGLVLVLYMGTEIGFSAWIPWYMQETGSIKLENATMISSAFWLTFTIGRAIAAAVGLRFEANTLIRACSIGMVISMALLSLSVGNIGLSIASIALFGLCCGPMFPTLLALVASSPTGDQDTSKVLLLGNVGGMLIPAMLGIMYNGFGPLAGNILLLGLTIAMVVLGKIVLKPRSRERRFA
jgi:fucose permease